MDKEGKRELVTHTAIRELKVGIEHQQEVWKTDNKDT